MRLQLALNVPDLNAAIAFYSKLFGASPAKVKPGYANWSLDEPSLKFVIFENPSAEPGSVNHLGFEVESAQEVVEHEHRLSSSGLETTGIDDSICCFAEKVETWVTDPCGHRWEVYVKTADVEMDSVTVPFGRSGVGVASDDARCCG